MNPETSSRAEVRVERREKLETKEEERTSSELEFATNLETLDIKLQYLAEI